MNMLVVLFCTVAAVSAAPHVVLPHGPLQAAYPASLAVGAPAIVNSRVAIAAPGLVAAVPRVVAAAPAVAVAPAIAVAPAVGTAITKTVHYANQPVVAGYTSTIVKPDLGAVATPFSTVTQQRVLAPARAVDTIVPQVTQVQPELHVQRVAVDVPVRTPVVSEVELRTPVVHAAPVAVAPSVAVAPAAVGIAAGPAIVDARAAYAAGSYVAAAPVGVVAKTSVYGVAPATVGVIAKDAFYKH